MHTRYLCASVSHVTRFTPKERKKDKIVRFFMETMRQLISSSNLCDLRRDKTQKMLRLMSQKALM